MICRSEGKSNSIMFFHIIVVFLMTFQDSRACVTNCTNKPEFSTSRLVVKYRDPANAVCSLCEECRTGKYSLEKATGVLTENGSSLYWKVNSMDIWSTNIMCYYEKNDTDDICCSLLPILVYQPPDAVFLRFEYHTGPMLEGDRYTLQCEVQNVAPVANLTVTFYRGQTELSQLQSNKTERVPVTETFTVDISPSKDDDGAQYRCEAKLHLGPEGPEPAPMVMSETINAIVHYKPQLVAPMPSGPVTQTVPEGDDLQLDCSAVGNPKPSYKWTVPSHGPSPGDSKNIFIINSTASEHSGVYTCVASNSLGKVTVKFDVTVKVNNMMYIIVGIIIGAAVLGFVVVILYVYHYKQNRMGKYNLFNVLRFRTPHSAVPTSE